MSSIASYTKTHDQRIQDDVMQQITWQPEIHSKDISVKVQDANVMLTGFVHGYLEKLAAERAAKTVFGVVSVANDIEVKPPSMRTDPEIARDVVEALRIHASVPDEKIKVAVSGGFVTLTGAVDWHYELENAETAAHSINGVRGIVNLLQIKQRATSEQVRQKIEDALKRMVDLDARSMSVYTSDGTVSLYGNVHSWSEREKAERAAWQAPGVQQVSNHLTIHP
ncbi:putative periplasmic or secreted lipoprotein [Terriglobus roseus DSM 18391]|uniref:Putative periplasmic or secreted lipoprotein n=1 Tax=Terriglobus roseus (strain DSM 18391 / NRRL B-41598 / KBS 63) TaxID=926566 RepID=I3ZHS1_TERRK|nr:BON domain-containing protein [Terriglobus roseus]AFL88447.1 putative periplasmic or secreted lipoprotein [Terriglobus roseus DSM 18391]AFL88789.1 putative periplasmic or secreted lipoprotein [Terriglobus roseus DSM 18391]